MPLLTVQHIILAALPFDFDLPLTRRLSSRMDGLYEPGQTLLLRFQNQLPADLPAADSSPSGSPLRVVITHAYRPFTMAVVLRVCVAEHDANVQSQSDLTPTPTSTASLPCSTPLASIDNKDRRPEFVLKLYDRRFMNNARNQGKRPRNWTEEVEGAYRRFMVGIQRAGGIEAKYPDWKKWDVTLANLRDKDGVLFEAMLERTCREMRKLEAAVYGRLESLQGSIVPRFYGTARLMSPHAADDSLAEVEGFLLEYVRGVSLGAYVESSLMCPHSPPCVSDAQLADVCDSAVQTVRKIGEYDYLNTDVRLDNVVVRLTSTDSKSLAVQLCPAVFEQKESFYRLQNIHRRIPKMPKRSTSQAPVQPVVTAGEDEEFMETHSAIEHDNGAMHRQSECVAIDFGSGRLRFADETDEQWRRAKQNAGEDWGIGGILVSIIRRIGILLATSTPPGDGQRSTRYIWSYRPNDRWNRTLSEEEQLLYEDDPEWGLYPGT